MTTLSAKTTTDVAPRKSTTETATAAISNRPSNSTGGGGDATTANDADGDAAERIGKAVPSERLALAAHLRNDKPTGRN